MGVFHVFFNCTNGTKSRNALQMDSILRVTRNWDIFFLSLYLIPTIDAKTCNRELKLFLGKQKSHLESLTIYFILEAIRFVLATKIISIYISANIMLFKQCSFTTNNYSITISFFLFLYHYICNVYLKRKETLFKIYFKILWMFKFSFNSHKNKTKDGKLDPQKTGITA